MIEWMHFTNFRVLKDARLLMRPLTVIIGPNGSGKSTALKALSALADPDFPAESLRSVGVTTAQGNTPGIAIKFADHALPQYAHWGATSKTEPAVVEFFRRARVYALHSEAIAKPMQLEKTFELNGDGSWLASVLTNLQDQYPERFDALNDELHRWVPEYDRVLFDTPNSGYRAFMLRTVEGGHRISAGSLSQGTLLALALLALAYVPSPPPLIGLEEPDHGMHPRLLRDVRDALFRLTNPQSFGEKRDPVQVVLTTHSPYLIDLFKDQLDSIVIAEKDGLYANFKRLSDMPHVDEILRDAHLGDAWYSGILGGVPAGT